MTGDQRHGEADAPYGLGGRLPLLSEEEMTAAQRSVFRALKEKEVVWAERSGFVAMDRQGHPVGPFNPVLYSPDLARSFLAFQGSEDGHTSLQDRVRQIVILTVGSTWRAAYEMYAYTAVGRGAGLSERQIGDLTDGRAPKGLSDTGYAAFDFTRQLTSDRAVSDECWAQAHDLLGSEGVIDMLFLIGAYQTVCGILNAVEVPVPG
ncbi:carboxymuconolactone decarboxylase family protein [Streptomyces sp. NPDC058459]|uniref:carboxymuconolactone decarboxylase family protein n=1 Tax=Streptomyces sp. NPDC058459 TaxID=3346508 RepID=UPI0036675F4F